MEFDWFIYWFMFPVSICIATTAMLSGIGGAAMFTPIFVIIFPILGPEYPFPSIAAAIGVALFTETFGFSSGFIAYYRKGLIDFKSALPFIAVGVPIGIVGALLLTTFKEFENVLRGGYALLMLGLAYELLRHHEPAAEMAKAGEEESPAQKALSEKRPMLQITGRDGTVYNYRAPRQGKGAVATGIGGFLTGLLGVGIGEVVMPQLVKRNHVPIPVAAATSVFVVIVVVAAASFTQISALVAEGGLQAVPWNAVIYTIPAVIIGGQIGPFLQGKVSQQALVKGIAYLFAVIGIAMGWIAIRNFFF
ncbi:MAG: sulfite exporter TauE/SafE family protein [Proteobacteria bacterium]|nr:sulfite exporter TauE/SafE family protein [Pseudomonadota bacterium]